MSDLSIGLLQPSAGPSVGPAARSPDGGSRRRLVAGAALALGDVAAAQAALWLAGLALAQLLGSPTTDAARTTSTEVAVAVAALAPGAFNGLYDAAGLSGFERFRMRLCSALLLPWISLALIALWRPISGEAVALLGATMTTFLPLALLAEAGLRRLLHARSMWCAEVVVIGCGEAAQRIIVNLLALPDCGLKPVGYYGEAGDAETLAPVPRLGALADTKRLTEIAVVALSPETRSIDLAGLPFDRILIVPEIGDIPAMSVRTRALGGITGLDFSNPSRLRLRLGAKRLLDLLVAVPAILLTSPVLLGMALAVKVVSPGPAFYVHARVGWKGRPVPIYKLRSMHLDAGRRLDELLRDDPAARHEWQTYVKLTRDPRILPVIGDFMRRASIDELPQLWNVVRGDISLVGPRPFPAYHVEKFAPEFQALRCSVQPGLTGLWQVSDRSGADLKRQEAIDTFYIRNWSLWLDLYIVVHTLPAVLSARGAR